MTTRLVLVRHGQAQDVDGRCIGHTDVPLAPEGAAAIRRLVAHRTALPSNRGGTVAVFSSDLARAIDSARLVAESIGVGVTTDARLREMHFGEWDGRRWSDVEAADGVRLHSWMERWTEASTPQGEALGDVARRAAAWLAEHMLAPAGEWRTVVAVAHAGWIRAAVSQLTGHSLAKMFDIPIDHAHATIIDVGVSGNHLIASNIDHFGDLSRSYQGDSERSVLPQPL